MRALAVTLDRALQCLRRRLGWAVAAAFLAAALTPGPGVRLRAEQSVALPVGGSLSWSAPALLLSLMLFTAGLQVPLDALRGLFRSPAALLCGLALHLAAPLLIIPGVALALRLTPDSDGGSGMIAAIILIVAMPVAAGATVWTGRGGGDQSTMVGLVLASTLLSPLTVPFTVCALSPLLAGAYPPLVASAAHVGGFTLVTVVLPCAAGVLCRLLAPRRTGGLLVRAASPVALLGSLVLTYSNASGALGPFLLHPNPLLVAAALMVATTVCASSFAVGRLAVALLRLDRHAGTSVTLACGMNNSSACAVLIATAMPGRPQVLMPVLAYSFLQKLAAQRLVRPSTRRLTADAARPAA